MQAVFAVLLILVFSLGVVVALNVASDWSRGWLLAGAASAFFLGFVVLWVGLRIAGYHLVGCRMNDALQTIRIECWKV